MLRATAQPHVMPALLASIRIRRAKATARCAWRDRGPTGALMSVQARVLHARPVHTPVHRPWWYALHVVRARSRIRSLVLARRRVQLVRWADTPQNQQWLVWIAMSASMCRLAIRLHVMPALLASIKILRAKATARCAWRDRGPTWALLPVHARVLHA